MSSSLSQMSMHGMGCRLSLALPNKNAQALHRLLVGQCRHHVCVAQSNICTTTCVRPTKLVSNFLAFYKICANIVRIYCLYIYAKKMHPWSLNILIEDHFPGCIINLTRFNFVTTHIYRLS